MRSELWTGAQNDLPISQILKVVPSRAVVNQNFRCYQSYVARQIRKEQGQVTLGRFYRRLEKTAQINSELLAKSE